MAGKIMSKIMASLKNPPTSQPSGRIPPEPTRAVYQTSDFAPKHQASPGPDHSCGEVVPGSIQGTLNRALELASGVIPPDPEK